MEQKNRDFLLVGLGLVLGVFFYNNRKRSLTNQTKVIVDPSAECQKKGGEWDGVERFCSRQK
jgi:hypothetical protein